MKLLLAGVCALALAGCQTTVNTATTAKTAADVKVRDAAKALSDNCALVQTAIMIGHTFAESAATKRRLAQAQAAANVYCSGPPPEDVAGALIKLAAIYQQVNAAVPEVKAHVL
jgi:hypothetical protein